MRHVYKSKHERKKEEKVLRKSLVCREVMPTAPAVDWGCVTEDLECHAMKQVLFS